jgi:hypothetical protein
VATADENHHASACKYIGGKEIVMKRL